MEEGRELIFGLRRWLLKGVNYVKDVDYDTFIDDEMRFDATCFVVNMASEIANRIVNNHPQLIDQFPMINFKKLAELQQNVFFGDNINMNKMFNFFKNDTFMDLFYLTKVIESWKKTK